MAYKNPYEHLKTPYLDDAPDIVPTSQITVSSHPAETIIIYTALHDDCWSYGYQVYWACGQVSTRQPSKSLGLFRSESDARLHCIGFMKAYQSHFRPETFENLRSAESRFLTPSLPLF